MTPSWHAPTSALEKIPKVIETHEKEAEKAKTDIEVYREIAVGTWKKEAELRSLKSQASELDRRITLSLKGGGEEDNTPENEEEVSQKIPKLSENKDNISKQSGVKNGLR